MKPKFAAMDKTWAAAELIGAGTMTTLNGEWTRAIS
jgi:hypothetical protein